MPILVSGSLIYDHIMDFHGSFKDHIMPENIHILNVAFGVESVKRGWGGTGGNIAYNIKLLGEDPILVSSIGNDGDGYIDYLNRLDIKTDHVLRDKDLPTSACYITTDLDDNQITAFYKGPTVLAGDISIGDIAGPIRVAIISPTVKDAMLKHIVESRKCDIETVFDPGQQMTAFDRDELRTAIDHSTFVFGNDYEIRLLEQRSEWGKDAILKKAGVLVTTLGGRGSQIETADGETIEVASCPAICVKDPTGAGDAFRAGFFVGYERGLDLRTCARMGSVAASYAIEIVGTQEHAFTLNDFKRRYEHAYGAPLSFK